MVVVFRCDTTQMAILDTWSALYNRFLPNPTQTSRVYELVAGEYWICVSHDDVIKWKHFRVTGPLCGEFTGHRWIPLTKASDAELWWFLWSAPWINGWVNNREAGDLRRHWAYYDVIVMNRYISLIMPQWFISVLFKSFMITSIKLRQ